MTKTAEALLPAVSVVRRPRSLLLACALPVLLAAGAHATTLTRARTASNVDWVSAGVGGISGDTADIVLTGVTGPVTKAYLYWDGMSVDPMDGVYDNATIAIGGNVIMGTSLGDTSANCWGGQGSSRAYVADVTTFVTGDGTYSLSGLQAQPTHEPNGASLVVLFDDGDPTNNRDLVFFEGNDSTSIDGYSGHEDKGWHALLDNIVYRSGTVKAQFHVADGQSTADGYVRFTVARGSLMIQDTASLWDGQSVPLAGVSRSPGDALWDIHTLDITALFDSAGIYSPYLDSLSQPADCISLVLLVIDLQSSPGAPVPICGDGIITAPEDCDDGNRVDGDCCDSNCHAEPAGTVCGVAGDPCLEARCDGAGACDTEGRSCRMPAAPEAGLLVLEHGRQDRLTWRWSPGTSTMADFGDPMNTTTYDLCLYDKGTGSLRLLSRASVPAAETCAGAPCWKTAARGYEYCSPSDPLQRLSLQGSNRPGFAKILARSAKGFPLPTMPLAPPVMVRLRARNGLCWGVNYTVPQRNSRRRFASRGDFWYPPGTTPASPR